MTSAVPAHRARRVGLTAFLAGSLVAGSAIVATTVAAPASADNAFTSLVTLQTGSANRWQWFPSDPGGTVVSQSIAATSTNNCTIKTPTGNVASMSGTPKGPGLRSGSIGIAEKNSGESCGQVNAPGEVLSIDLGSKIANQAALDLELQKNAVVLATLTGPSGTTYLELQTGSSITGTRTPAPAGGAPAGEDVTLATCQVEASSAPNSGASDNCRWVIDATFTAISLKAVTGNASLEGGADGSVTRLSSTEGVQDAEPLADARNLTYFRVVEACTEQNTLTTIASTGGTGLPTGQVKRSLTNVDGTPCLTDGLTAEAKDAETVDILKKGQPYAQYIVKIGWRKAPTTAALESLAVSETTIEFDIGQGPENLSDPATLPWCPTSLFDSTTSEPVTGGGTVLKALESGLSDSALKDALTDLNISDMDGVDTNSVQFACIQDRDVDYLPASGDDAATFVVNDLIYVMGDLRFRS